MYPDRSIHTLQLILDQKEPPELPVFEFAKKLKKKLFM